MGENYVRMMMCQKSAVWSCKFTPEVGCQLSGALLHGTFESDGNSKGRGGTEEEGQFVATRMGAMDEKLSRKRSYGRPLGPMVMGGVPVMDRAISPQASQKLRLVESSAVVMRNKDE